jgi:NADH-quinone oxidoreductase subunit N
MNMTTVLAAMLPEHVLLLGIVVVIGLAIAGRDRRGALAVAFASVAVAAMAALRLAADGYAAAPFAGQFSVDAASLLVKGVVLALALPVLLMARDEFEGAEFPALVLSSLYGVCLLQSADGFAVLFLGLELMSLPVYVLVLLADRRTQSAEAALKYLVLGGTATATFLMGASLLYGAGGSLANAAFAKALAANDGLARAAVVLVTLAFFLKAAIVPFHAWAPDAYEGASVPVTAYMATLVKAGVLLAAVRLFGRGEAATPFLQIVALLPLASIVWGNLAAMRQPGLRRMIAYSSIAHAGYLFYALLGAPAGRLQAVAFYLVAYGLMNLLAFAALPPADDDAERDRLENLKGLFQRAPFAAVMLALAMLSLAGIPPFPGFVAKFLIFRTVVAAGHPAWATLGLVASYLGIYFYLRVIQLMFMSPASVAGDARAGRLPARLATAACLAAALLVMVFPGWVMARF